MIQKQINQAQQEGAKAPLLGYKGISPHLLEGSDLLTIEHNLSLYAQNPFIKELSDLGFSKSSLNSILSCGLAKDFIIAQCGCGSRIVPLVNHCDLRTCSNCADRRKKRIRRRYLPFMRRLQADRKHFFYFLTISPPHVKDLKQGIKRLQDAFVKFRRLDYVKDRILSGFYVIETKQKGDLWHVHLHAVIYGRHLDNKLRGKCMECGQSLMKKDRVTGKFYCVSCSSLNVFVKPRSIVVEKFSKCYGDSVNVDIRGLSSQEYALNYVLKYVSMSKEDFQDVKSYAYYVATTRKQRLFNAFGWGKGISFFLYKERYYCNVCDEEIVYKYDFELASSLYFQTLKPDAKIPAGN